MKNLEEIAKAIQIRKENILNIRTDAIVNAANEHLQQGGGVCGAIFHAAGATKLRLVCDGFGHCDTGHAVLTPAFDHPNSRFIIHAVGPRWKGGEHGEPELLYNAYLSALRLARENGCHSIAFPLISSGIYGYPVPDAWYQALRACRDFLYRDVQDDFSVIFAVLQDAVYEKGVSIKEEILTDMDEKLPDGEIVAFYA